ncbi:MAG: hypothetical protein AB7O45_15640 [Alphaproteobacteria bacterium]
MVRRFFRAAFLALAALAAGIPAADAQDLLYFRMRNCDQDKATVDMRVYDGADNATAFPHTETLAMVYGEEAGFRCVRGKNIWDYGCKVRVHKGNTIYEFRVEGPSCFEGAFDYWFKTYGNCSC